MSNIPLKTTFILTLVMLLLASSAYPQRKAPVATTDELNKEIREYISENGFRIELTTAGNLIGLESPVGFDYIERRFTKEGYLLSYRTPDGISRTVYDIYSYRSYSILNTQPDLIPVAFEGPANGSIWANGTILNARSIVKTSDNLLQLTHIFTWQVGSGQVSIRTVITNTHPDRAIELLAFKRIVDINIGLGSTNQTVEEWHIATPYEEARDSIEVAYCNCPPPIPGPPIGFGIVSLQGEPAVQSLTIKSAQQTGDLFSERSETSLPNDSIGDNLGVLGWQNSTLLNPQASSSFTTNISVLK